MIDCLHLDITHYSCICGNKWDHSETWLASKEAGYLGGTPTPQQEHDLKVDSMKEQNANVNHCHRCVPLQLGKNWVSNQKLVILEIKNNHLKAMGTTLDDLLA